MFDKQFFDELEGRLEKYFQHFPSAERAGVIINTYHGDEFLLVGIIDLDDRFIVFGHWPMENADIPRQWKNPKNSLPAITLSYSDIRSVEFDPKVVRGSEIGFTKNESVKMKQQPPSPQS